MYTPPSFRIDDPVKLSAFMDANSFAALITSKGGVPSATHLPVRHFAEGGVFTKLVSHMARANPQWQDFASDVEVLTVFSGPHAYISPSWYVVDNAVPTWNYAAVHVYGYPRIIDDHERVVSFLTDTVEFYERSFARPWPGVLPDEFRDKMIKAIVAFEIAVTRIEGKFKLGQNRSAADIRGVYTALSNSLTPGDRQLASLMVSERLAGTSEIIPS